MTYVDNSSNRKLLASTLHNLYKKSVFVPCMDVFLIDNCDLENKTNKLIFSDKLFLYHGKLFHLNIFNRQVVALWREIGSLQYFSQTRSVELLIQLLDLLRQPVTSLGVLVPHERIPQTSGLKPLIKSIFRNNRFSRWRRMIESSWGNSF